MVRQQKGKSREDFLSIVADSEPNSGEREKAEKCFFMIRLASVINFLGGWTPPFCRWQKTKTADGSHPAMVRQKKSNPVGMADSEPNYGESVGLSVRRLCLVFASVYRFLGG